MMMIADFTESKKPFAQCQNDLTELGKEIGVDVKCQREEIFEKMHRI